MHPVKVNTLRHNVVANENKRNSNKIFQPIRMWLSTIERVISVLARGFPKEDMKRQSAHWSSAEQCIEISCTRHCIQK